MTYICQTIVTFVIYRLLVTLTIVEHHLRSLRLKIKNETLFILSIAGGYKTQSESRFLII